ncbi:MAG: low molecular weight phosphotyrosine protein phosphatase, partial [Xanthomonadales bacterium]|nr:low molecular weight phosphotyrosine protein phosphatase [Xanthomonadales bacterium]
MTTRILVVCLGNICRSPMGQGVIEHRAAEAGLAVEVDSAGLGSWHIGNPPNPRGLKVAAARGYDNSRQRARQVRADDFH